MPAARRRGVPAHSALQFRIVLLETSPVVWRRILVPAAYTFWDLHVAIQDAMGWTDSHLHAFEVRGPGRRRTAIGIPVEEGEEAVVPGWKRELTTQFGEPGDQLIYEYDFGDAWRHSVLLERIAALEPGQRLPACLDGARRCPPEDVGGPPGFAEFLRIIADPAHEEHQEMLEWCGGSFDPADFDCWCVRFHDPKARLRAMLRGS